jgi:hypothetical protein
VLRWMGYKQVAVKTIVLPSDVKRRQKLPHVIELAKSIAELGEEPIHAPTIAAKTKKLIAGRDRMAALLLNEVSDCWVRLVEGTKQELADLEVDENLHRRHDNRDELIARRVAKVEGQIEAEIEAGELPDTAYGNAGRPKTARGEARERVARELGTTSEAVRAAEHRATAKASPAPSEGKPLVPPVEIWGLPIPEAMPGYEFAEIVNVQREIDAADKALRAAQAALTKLGEGGGCGVIGQRLAAMLRANVHDVAAAVRRARPAALCPYCKGIVERRAKCTGCQGIGYVGEEALEGIADELKRPGAGAMVFDGGRLIPIAKARDTKPARGPIAPQPKPQSKRLQIQDGDGNPIDVDDDLAF